MEIAIALRAWQITIQTQPSAEPSKFRLYRELRKETAYRIHCMDKEEKVTRCAQSSSVSTSVTPCEKREMSCISGFLRELIRDQHREIVQSALRRHSDPTVVGT
jgi:hypothetical protein